MNGVATPAKAVDENAVPVTVHERAAVGPMPWLALGVAATTALALYAPVIAGMVSDWSEFPNLSHGFEIGRAHV